MSSIFPSSVSAGLTFDRTATITDCPAPTWALSAALRGPTVIDLTAAASGIAHRFLVAAAVTADWAAGEYWYSIRAASAGTVIEVEAGQIIVNPDLAAAIANHDGRDHARRVLDAIEAVIEKRATLDQDRYMINNRELWRTPIADLLALRDRYRAELRRIKAVKAGGLFDTAVRVRFS